MDTIYVFDCGWFLENRDGPFKWYALHDDHSINLDPTTIRYTKKNEECPGLFGGLVAISNDNTDPEKIIDQVKTLVPF